MPNTNNAHGPHLHDRGPGRPPVGTPIKIAFPAEMLASIDEAADHAGMTRSAWVRAVCTHALEGERDHAPWVGNALVVECAGNLFAAMDNHRYLLIGCDEILTADEIASAGSVRTVISSAGAIPDSRWRYDRTHGWIQP